MLTDAEIRKSVQELVAGSLPISSMRGLDNENFVPGETQIQYSGPTWTNEEIERAITDKPKAVMFSHVLGNPPDMDRVVKICKERNLLLLEDNCDALGSTWRGKPLGSFGLMSSHSFYPSHHITTGEGGLVSMDD